MARLFVALELPDDLKTELMRLQPLRQRGVRLAKREQLHLTLHFLGDVPVDPVVATLESVRSSAFSLSFAGVGRFSNRRGPSILWAGVESSPQLSSLSLALENALRPAGHLPEPRPFSPHITLARCEPGTPKTVIQEFLDQHAGWSYRSIRVTGFALYSSELSAAGSVYRRLKVFDLSAAA